MIEVTPTMAIPLTISEEGVIRVGDSRVRLDTVIYAFNDGYTVEEIVAQYPALDLTDVYAVIAFYLGHRPAVDEYIAERAGKAAAIKGEIESKPEYQAFRQQLLDRKAKLQANTP